MKNVTDSFKQRKNSVTPNFIHLYAIQFDKTGNQWLRYTSNPVDVTFGGLLYHAYVISHSRIGENLDGTISKVSLSIGNVDRQIQYYLENWNGLRDAEVKITTVFSEELTNPTCFDEYVFAVADVAVDSGFANFVLASKLDVLDIALPRRKFYRTYCTHDFKGEGCAYSGLETTCSKSLQRCLELGNEFRFGAFPAIPQKTVYLRNV